MLEKSPCSAKNYVWSRLVNCSQKISNSHISSSPNQWMQLAQLRSASNCDDNWYSLHVPPTICRSDKLGMATAPFQFTASMTKGRRNYKRALLAKDPFRNSFCLQCQRSFHRCLDCFTRYSCTADPVHIPRLSGYNGLGNLLQRIFSYKRRFVLLQDHNFNDSPA